VDIISLACTAHLYRNQSIFNASPQSRHLFQKLDVFQQINRSQSINSFNGSSKIRNLHSIIVATVTLHTNRDIATISISPDKLPNEHGLVDVSEDDGGGVFLLELRAAQGEIEDDVALEQLVKVEAFL
jgi:hypothetical protein